MFKGKKLFSTLFLTPAFLIYTILFIVPIILTFYYSLNKWDGVGAMRFLGLNNYIELLKNDDYWKVVKNTGVLVVFNLIFQVPLGMLLAYLLYRTLKGFKFFRAVFFLPVVIAPVAIGVMFTLFYNSEVGPLNKILTSIGMPWAASNWLSDPKIVLYSVMIPQTWRLIGLYIVIFLAGLMSIPEEILESARIDGASSVQIFFKIIVPLLWEVISICIILCFTWSLKTFDVPFTMTWGGPGVLSSFLAVFMFRTSFNDSEMGLGSAIAMTILLFALVFTVLFKKFFSSENIQD